MSEEAGSRLERLGLGRDRWTLVGNTPDVPRVRQHAESRASLPGLVSQGDVLVFTGILVGDRGIEVALRGLAELIHTRRRKTSVVIIGAGPSESRYRREAERLELGDRAQFLGWKPHDELPGYWSSANVGILPFHVCPHIDTTLANKLFDYMAVGLPIVASDARPMVRVLAQTGAGITFRSGDAKDFAKAVTKVLDDPGCAARLRRAGLHAADEIYNWEKDAERLLSAVEFP